MSKISLEDCKWCKGTGTEDGHYPCFGGCEGTGFKYGKQAEMEWERQIEELAKKHS